MNTRNEKNVLADAGLHVRRRIQDSGGHGLLAPEGKESPAVLLLPQYLLVSVPTTVCASWRARDLQTASMGAASSLGSDTVPPGTWQENITTVGTVIIALGKRTLL